MNAKRETPQPALRVGGNGRQNALRLNAILPHLGNARQLPSGEWLVCCPSHPDSNPSLSLRELPDGTLLWHCHAGCAQQKVGEALRKLAGVDAQPTAPNAPRFTGCTVQQLCEAKLLNPELLKQWGVSDGRYGGVDAVRIPYLNEQGETLSVQWRVGADGERFRRTGSPTLYGLWRLGEYSGQNLWVVEGVSDCWTLWHANIPCLAFPNNNPPEALLQHFWDIATRFQNLYILPDSDDAGRVLVQRLAETCPRDLRERVKVVPLPDGVKDASDLWVSVGGDADAFKAQLAQCLQNPQLFTQFTNLSVGACQTGETGETGETDDDFHFTPVPYSALETEIAEVLVPNLLHAGRTTLLAGIPGVGKSIFALELADALESGGVLWGRVPVPQCKILWLDFDDSFARLKELMETHYGSRPRNIITLPPEQLLPLSYTTFPAYRELIQREGVGVVVVDTLLDWVEAVDANDEAEAREKMTMIRALARETGAALLLLHHPRKESETNLNPTSTAVSGHIRWAGKADTVALLRFDSREGEDAVVLSVLKCRDGQKWKARFLRANYRFIPCDEAHLPASEWRVVKEYLQQVGEATYAQLMDALKRAGFTLTERAFQHKVARWRNRGMVVVDRRGFPAVAYVKLPTVQLTPPTESPQFTQFTQFTRGIETGGQTGQTDTGADFHALLETLTRPDDPFALEPHEVDLLRVLWREAQQRDFPRLELPAYDLFIPQGCSPWLGALRLMAGTPAVPCALALLRGEPEPPAPESPQLPPQPADTGELETRVWKLAQRLGYPPLAVDAGSFTLHIAQGEAGWQAGIPALRKDGLLPAALQALQQVLDAGATALAACATHPLRPAESEDVPPTGQITH